MSASRIATVIAVAGLSVLAGCGQHEGTSNAGGQQPVAATASPEQQARDVAERYATQISEMFNKRGTVPASEDEARRVFSAVACPEQVTAVLGQWHKLAEARNDPRADWTGAGSMRAVVDAVTVHGDTAELTMTTSTSSNPPQARTLTMIRAGANGWQVCATRPPR